MTIPKATRATIMPCLRYRDAPAAIDWLCKTLGFKAALVVPNEDGTIAHAQLSYGNGMVMLSSIFDTDYGRLLKQPAQLGMAVTQTAYLVVNDADEVDALAGRRLRRPWLYLPRSRGACVEHRHL
jgi:uncharacterized glyoxalase superfamily protein PhnB